VLSGYGYVLDKVGNRIEVESYNEGIQQYRYDKLYRLTLWTNPQRETTQWMYDAAGNRLQQVGPQGTVNYTYDAADEMLTAGTSSFTYDSNGNQFTKASGGATTNYSWDALNRLTAVVTGSNGTQYQYDGDGNRVSQQISTGTYAYVNDPATALPVVLSENGPDGNISYAYGDSLVSASATGLQSFYQFDGLGSVATVTDQSASVKASYSYDPWGNAASNIDLLGQKNKFKFTGEALDPVTGLVYLRARYYDPTAGHLLSRDPLTRSDQSAVPAPYVYVGNSPVQRVDPTGLFGISLDQFLQAYSQTIHSLPSWAECGGGYLDIGDSCKQQGLAPWQVAVGSDVVDLATGGVGVGVKIAVQGSIQAAELIWKGKNGTLTPDDLLNASENTLLDLASALDVDLPPTSTAQYLLNQWLESAILQAVRPSKTGK
jgi:RHS repeat-associated protein